MDPGKDTHLGRRRKGERGREGEGEGGGRKGKRERERGRRERNGEINDARISTPFTITAYV